VRFAQEFWHTAKIRRPKQEVGRQIWWILHVLRELAR